MNLAREEDVSGRLAGYQLVEAVEKQECDRFADAGKSRQKGSSAMYRGTHAQITYSMSFSSAKLCAGGHQNGTPEYVWRADYMTDVCL